jgi:hypothetical protein
MEGKQTAKKAAKISGECPSAYKKEDAKLKPFKRFKEKMEKKKCFIKKRGSCKDNEREIPKKTGENY